MKKKILKMDFSFSFLLLQRFIVPNKQRSQSNVKLNSVATSNWAVIAASVFLIAKFSQLMLLEMYKEQ